MKKPFVLVAATLVFLGGVTSSSSAEYTGIQITASETNITTNVRVGDTVQFTVNTFVQGGVDVHYQFLTRAGYDQPDWGGNEWTIVQDWSASNTVSVPFNEEGIYFLAAHLERAGEAWTFGDPQTGIVVEVSESSDCNTEPLIPILGCPVSPPPVTPGLCQDGVVRIDSREPEQSAHGPVTLKVSGFDGVDCNILEQPLAAVNWYTYPTNLADIDSIAAYQAGMVPILRGYGTRILFVGNETESLIETEDLLAPADCIALPLYGHAEAFLRMVTSQAFLDIAPLKIDLEFESYSFVFQECVIGCDTLAVFPLPNVRPPAMVFQIAVDDDPYDFGEEDRNNMRSVIMNVDRAFAADGRYKLAYGGVSVAHPTVLMSDGTEDFLFKANGIDVTLIVVPTIDTDVASVLDTDLLAPIFNEALSVAAIKVH